MKRILLPSLFLIGLLVLAGFRVTAAGDAEPANPKIASAAALIAEGKSQQARELLTTIPPTDPAYTLAQGYKVIALDPDDDMGVLKAVEKTPLESLDLPAGLKEQVAVREIKALFKFRKFDPLLAKIAAFGAAHPESASSTAVLDYRLAGLFDRGMKKTEEACRYSDEEVFNKRWPEGKANLEEFLVLVTSTGAANYRTLPKRDLKQDAQIARLVLGDENALWSELPATDAVAREQLSLLRLRLSQRLYKHKTDENLKLAREFLEQFPKSAHRKRVEYEMADIALCGGERLNLEAWRANNGLILLEKRAAAVPHFDLAERLYNSVVEDDAAGISKADVQESRIAMVRISYGKRDWDGLSNWAAYLVTNSPPHGKVWLAAKLYNGCGLTRQRKFSEAANELDEVLAMGFKNNPSFDGLLISAAEWRIVVAKVTDDQAAARRVAEAVQSSDCYGSIKRTFLKKYPHLIAEPGAATK